MKKLSEMPKNIQLTEKRMPTNEKKEIKKDKKTNLLGNINRKQCKLKINLPLILTKYNL